MSISKQMSRFKQDPAWLGNEANIVNSGDGGDGAAATPKKTRAKKEGATPRKPRAAPKKKDAAKAMTEDNIDNHEQGEAKVEDGQDGEAGDSPEGVPPTPKGKSNKVYISPSSFPKNERLYVLTHKRSSPAASPSPAALAKPRSPPQSTKRITTTCKWTASLTTLLTSFLAVRSQLVWARRGSSVPRVPPIVDVTDLFPTAPRSPPRKETAPTASRMRVREMPIMMLQKGRRRRITRSIKLVVW